MFILWAIYLGHINYASIHADRTRGDRAFVCTDLPGARRFRSCETFRSAFRTDRAWTGGAAREKPSRSRYVPFFLESRFEIGRSGWPAEFHSENEPLEIPARWGKKALSMC